MKSPTVWRICFTCRRNGTVAFDFVLKQNTAQALPASIRAEAIQRIASLVRPGGKLLAIVRGRESHEPEGELPLPLTRTEMDEFVRAGPQLRKVSRNTLTTQSRLREDSESCTPGHKKRNAC